jgi:recombinational DNA repair protein (RecF pathway)
VRASAQGIRLHKSKLRFALQDFCYANIDLVRGRDIWRIGSATTISSFPIARTKKETTLFIARICGLIDRLCDGEEANEKIFDDIIQTLYLLDDENLLKETREALELHLVLRIVHSLGYIGDSDTLTEYLGNDINTNFTKSLLRNRRDIVTHINNALRESQL